ncbi:MAG: adenylate/guanylate cyclase domain-containing protein [Ginsengibacter sp.]
MKKTNICLGCWEQMHAPIAIRGPFSILFRPFGIKKSQMHPNLCTSCESMFTRVKKSKQIAISTTILFADLRGYTNLSQRTEGSKVNELLHCFYDQCSSAVWEREGIINKFIGDAALAIFNFPLVRKDHVKNAVKAAAELQKNCENLKDRIGLASEENIGVGIGIHTGECFLGEVGTSYKDFTAVGPIVNLASRLQGAAGAGEILVTDVVYNHVNDIFPYSQMKTVTLKGIHDPVKAYVLDYMNIAV